MLSYINSNEDNYAVAVIGYDTETFEIPTHFQGIKVKDFFDFLEGYYRDKLRKQGYDLDGDNNIVEISEYKGI